MTIHHSPAEQPADTFAALAELLYSEDGYDETYQALCDAAPRIIPGCHHASLMLRRGDHRETVAASDEVAARVDAAERELGEGPCVDVLDTERAEVDSDLTVDPTWPRLAAWVVANTPVRGMAGYRLLVDGKKVGALNFFSDTPGALAGPSADQAAVFSAFASVAVMAAHHRESARHLRQALDTNREIGKAVGLLMALHKVGDEEAFEILRQTSQDLNVRLAMVAKEVVDYHREPSA